MLLTLLIWFQISLGLNFPPTTSPTTSPTHATMSAPPRANKATHHLLSGATSGLASAVMLQPLDLVKTRLQQGPATGAGKALVGRRTLTGVVREVVRDEGWTGLWRGTVPTVVR